MNVRFVWTFSLSLSKEEFRLISKALRGALRDEDKEPALELQKKMLRDKHEILRQAINESQKAIDNIDATES